MFTTLQRVIENPLSRVVFSIAIIVSLVPHDFLKANDAWFLLLFGPEVFVRTLLCFRKESLPVPPGRRLRAGWRWPTGGEIALQVLDVVACLSFIPGIAETAFGARWLRLFRLTRTILLLRYWAPVVRDLWEVVSRPERRRQVFFVFGALICACFAGTVVLDHITTESGDDFDGDGEVGDAHDHYFLVRMWWSFRQIEDPGNLLASPQDAGTLLVSVLLTLSGLFVISFIIGMGANTVADLGNLAQIRSPGLRGHTVLVNATNSARRLLRELLHEEFKAGARRGRFGRSTRGRQAGRTFLVVGASSERPDFLREREFRAVVYRAWEDDADDTLLNRGDILTAARVVVLADKNRDHPDDGCIRTSLSIVEQLRECEDNDARRLLVEILDLESLPAAEQSCMRAIEPVEATVVPTEVLIARCVAAVCRRQGLADLLTQLLRSQGREIYTHILPDHASALRGIEGEMPLEALARRGVGRPGSDRVIPLGLVVREGDRRSRAVLNPDKVGGEVRGLIAMADWAGSLVELLDDRSSPREEDVPKVELEFESRPRLERVLVCGFRRATVQLLENLLASEPGASVLLLVGDEDARADAMTQFVAQGALAAQGLVRAQDGTFAAVDETTIRWTPSDGSQPADVRIEVADWTNTRTLTELPSEVAHALDYDLVLFSTDAAGGADARNTAGVMTLEALAKSRPDRRPRIVVEVDDVDLAARLNERFRSMGRHEIQVFSVDELRALLLFQSAAVAYFTEVFESLIQPGGRGLVPFRAKVDGPEQASFAAVSWALRKEGRILVAVDEDNVVRLGSGFGREDMVSLDKARLWVVVAHGGQRGPV